MPVDPFLEPLLSQFQPMPDDVAEHMPEFRAQATAMVEGLVDALAEPGPEVRERRAHLVDVAGGAIEVLVYQPFEPGPHPVHLYFHGGGWVAGSAGEPGVDILARERCIGASCVVVSVDYRLAPEHKFPVALNDCHAVLDWVVANADELEVRTDAITIGGGSAGANLAAALALKVRDEGGPSIAFQLLEVPSLDLTLSLPSHTEYDGYALHKKDVEALRIMYLPDPELVTNPYVSPLHSSDLSGLPAAHIMTAEYDMLRDDGAEYARKLREAGVPVTVAMHAGHVHSSAGITKTMEIARIWRDEAIATLRLANSDAIETAKAAHVE